jgi:hypothetical protein
MGNVIPDPIAADVAALEQIERDQQSGATPDEQMARLVHREKLRTAKATLARLNQTIASWPTEAERLAAIARKQEEERNSSRMVATAQARRARAPELVYKTKWNADPDVVARHRAATARAREILAKHGADNEPKQMVYKTNPNGLITKGSESATPMTEIETTEQPSPLSPYEVLADELGLFAGRLEKETSLKFKNLKAELELDVERRLNQQSVEIAELRGQLAALLGTKSPRAARTERSRTTDFDFNEARSLTRN